MQFAESSSSRSSPTTKPYAMIGAGRLTSALWKTGNEDAGYCYRFNVFRLGANGRTGQRLRPSDLKHFVKLAAVLSATIADDGCLPESEQRELVLLATRLAEIIRALS